MFKRENDKNYLAGAPNVYPVPTAETNVGRKADAIMVAEESKRQRMAQPSGLIDAQLVNSYERLFTSFTSQNLATGEQVDQLRNQINLLQNQINLLLNFQHPMRTSSLFVNSCAVNNEAPLMSVPRVEDLTTPREFPGTFSEFFILGHDQLNALLDFYHMDFNQNWNLEQKRRFLCPILQIRIR